MSSRRPGERRSQEETKEKRGFREGQSRTMYQEFMKETENFIFVEDRPEKADIIFVPGNGYPQMAERAAALYKEGYAGLILPSGKYSITAGCFSGVLSKEEEYAGSYRTEWEFLRDVLIKNGVAPEHILKNIPTVVRVGGSAEDFEIPEMLMEEFAEYRIVCGRGNIRGSEGPRNAVATGLVLSYIGEQN